MVLAIYRSTIVIATGKELQVGEVHNGKISNLKVVNNAHSDIIRSIDISKDNKYIVSCGDDKNVILWNLEKQTIIAKKIFPKKITNVLIEPIENPKYIVAADRFGDIFVLNILDNNTLEIDPTLSFGHFSFITSLKFVELEQNNNANSSKHVLVSADGDEKIRVSYWPKTYNILSFCLGHSEFVSTLQPLAPSYFASGSADGELVVWNVNGDCVDKFSSSSLIALEPHPQHHNLFEEAAANVEVVEDDKDKTLTEADKQLRRQMKKAENTRLMKEQLELRSQSQITLSANMISLVAYCNSLNIIAFYRHYSNKVYFLNLKNNKVTLHSELVLPFPQASKKFVEDISFVGERLIVHADFKLRIYDNVNSTYQLSSEFDCNGNETVDHILKHLVGSKEYIKIDMAASMEKRKEQKHNAKKLYKSNTSDKVEVSESEDDDEIFEEEDLSE